MTKPISTRTHGIVDYSWSAAARSAAGHVGGATSTALLLRRAADVATATSLLTRYECGALRLLPMKSHLTIDKLLCGALVASPLFLPASERRYALLPMLFGAFGLVASMLTESRSPVEFDEEFGVYGGGERSSIADPDIAAAPHLRLHLE